MALFDNIGSLMNTLMQPDDHEETKNLANKAGVDTTDFAKIASIGLPLLLQGMNRNNKDQVGLESFNQALKQHQERNNYDSFNQFSRNVDPQDGDKIVGHVFKLEEGEALLITPCNSIHTFGMKFPIDVAFVDEEGRVLKIMASTPKGKMSPIVKGAKYVIEARAGEFASKGLEVGDVLEIK